LEKDNEYNYDHWIDAINDYLDNYATRDVVGVVFSAITISVACRFIGVTGGALFSIKLFLVSYMFARLHGKRPKIFDILGPYPVTRVVTKTLLIFIFSISAVPLSKSTEKHTSPADINAESFKEQNWTAEEQLTRINNLMANWPYIMEGGTQGYDSQYVQGLLVVVFASGYVCDSISSISSSYDRVDVRCNHGALAYVLEPSLGGIPVARPL